MDRKNSDIDFVAKHYRQGAFSARRAWLKTGIATPPLWSRFKVAAVIALVVVTGATAALLINRQNISTGNTEQTIQSETETLPYATIHPIDFDNVTLSDVVREIRTTYGVDIEGVPADADNYRLTLHYEGNATDLIETINELLNTQMKIVAQ